MRWFVEISPIGQNAGPSTTVCVEAPQWKHALQKARALRGDNGALSNFSIELLEDGFRAIDPTTRLRYIVKRAPDDTPQTSATSTPPPTAAGPAAAPAFPIAVPPPEPKKRALAQTVAFTSTGAAVIAKPEPPAPKPAAAPAPAPAPAPSAVVVPAPEPKKHALSQMMAYSSTGAAALREPVAEAPAKPAPAPGAAKAAEPPAAAKPVEVPAVKPAPAPAVKPGAAVKPAPAPAAKLAAAPPSAGPTPSGDVAPPSFVLVGSREENPTESSPLTYREFVFAVAPGTSEAEASRLIMDRYEHVRATVEGARSGKLINLAVFDHVFHGRPQRRPLVTLTWKDWKAEPPEIHYPAREEAPRASAASPASMPQPSPRPAVAPPEAPVAAAPKAISTTLASAKPISLPRTAPEAEVPVVAASKPVPVKAVEPAPVKAAVGAPVKAIEAAAMKAIEPMPVKAIEAAPVKPVEAAPMKAIEPMPVKAIEAAPAKAIEPMPVKAIEAAPVKAVEPMPAKAVEATPASKATTRPEIVAPTPIAEPAKVAPPALTVEAVPETRAVPTVASPVATPAAAEPAVADDEIDIPIEAETATPPPFAPAAPPPSNVAAAPVTARAGAASPPDGAAARPAPRKRLSGDDLLTELFEAFGDLHFLRDSLEGAEFVLALTMEKLPSEVGLVSLFDMNKREFVIVRQSGGPRSALCARQPERAAVASTAMRKHQAIVVTDPAGAQRAMDDRWRAIGVELKSLVCAPVELAGRYLGLIEIANPLDGDVYNDGDGHALTYIGQQLGEFVASRGVIVDPEQIRAEPRPSAPPPPARGAGKKSR